MRERERPHGQEKNKLVFLFLLLLLSLPPCCCHTFSFSFPHLTPPPYLPFHSYPFSPLALAAPFCVTEQAAIAPRGEEESVASLSASFSFALSPMIYLSFIHGGISPEIGEKKSIFQQRSYQFVQFTQHPSPPLLFSKDQALCAAHSKRTVVCGNNRWLCVCVCDLITPLCVRLRDSVSDG